MMGEIISSVDGEMRLKRLYVLLGRIGGLDKYVWEEMDHKEQVKDFYSEYKDLKDVPQTSGNKHEGRFTRESVLRGTITAEDRAFRTTETFKGAIGIKEETLLHRAISLIGYKDESTDSDLRNIINMLIEDLPFLLKYDRSGSTEYDGESPLHLAVLKEDARIVKSIARAVTTAKQSSNGKDTKFSLDVVARGSKFQGTVMMAGTPLCVAALTLNTKIFRILVGKSANIEGTNKYLENMCHSLVRYAHYWPDKLDKICKMLAFILKCTWKKGRENITETQKLLMMENKDGLNPLQLATRFHMHQLFQELFSYEVYCKENLLDSLRDDQWYDVTEIDTLPVPVSAEDSENDDSKEDHVSLLPTILLQSPQSAIKFLDFPPVRQVIEQKWNRYRKIVVVWGLLHMAFICGLTYTAIRRAQLTVSNLNESLSDRPNFTYRVPTDAIVTVMGAFGVFIGLVYICLQITRCITGYYRKSLKLSDICKAFKYPHSNIIYKCLFFLFSVCLILDFIIALSRVDTYENSALMAAVVMGSYLLLFFIQIIRPLSFFTSLIQIVMIDLFKFAIVLSIFLMAFSTAMYMVMQGAHSEDNTFHSYKSTVMKMFNVMLGLGDIDTLFQARHPDSAIAVFVVFVLLTTLLLLNALLAIMANTCSSLLERYGEVTAVTLYYRLHKLSTILFIEDMLPQKWQVSVGEIEERKRFKNGKWYKNVRRRMIHHFCLTANDENIREEFSALEGMLHYFRGSSSKSKHKKKNDSKIGPTMIRQLGASETIDIHNMTPIHQSAFANRDLLTIEKSALPT